MRLACVMLAVCCAAGCSRPTETRVTAEVIGCTRADLDSDGAPETVTITCEKRIDSHPLGGEIVVSHDDGGQPRVIWRQGKLNPWKLQIADLDGDLNREIVVGVWKKSPKDRVMAKRVFVYSWNGKRMLPKWLP